MRAGKQNTQWSEKHTLFPDQSIVSELHIHVHQKRFCSASGENEQGEVRQSSQTKLINHKLNH